MDDSRIIDLFLARDQQAIEQTQECYSAALRAVGMNILGDRRDAEECESDAYLRAWESIPPQEPRGYLFAYLARIVRHAALDICRRAGRKKRSAVVIELSSELEQCIPSPDDRLCRVEGDELAGAVSSFLRTQGESVRAVFVRRYWYCDSIAAICSRYDISESKAKSMLKRSRDRLKKYLIKEGYEL